MTDRTRGLGTAVEHARAFLEGLDDRPVGAQADADAIREVLGGPLPERGEDPEAVLAALVAGADPGLVASGGSLPAALAADWLVSAWDQAPGFHALSPAGAAIEEITAGWVLELLGLPASASVGFVTGGQGANTTCLAAARNRVLARADWDVEANGLAGAPRVRILCGEQAHTTVFRSLRLLGLGSETALRVEADDQGRMRPEALRTALAGGDGPAIVCAQAGNVATGAF